MSSRLVYSSDGGRVQDERAPKSGSGGKKGSRSAGLGIPATPEDGWVRLWRMKGGRGGKTVTVVTGAGTGDALEKLGVDLRRFIGAGGAIRDGAIEIQGEHRERLQKRLTELGFRVKLAGG